MFVVALYGIFRLAMYGMRLLPRFCLLFCPEESEADSQGDEINGIPDSVALLPKSSHK